MNNEIALRIALALQRIANSLDSNFGALPMIEASLGDISRALCGERVPKIPLVEIIGAIADAVEK